MVTRIGIDFDNTIVNYEDAFYREALKRKIFNFNTTKKNIKNRLKGKLINNNKECEWTKIQGLIYGKNLNKAKPYKGSVEFLNKYSLKKDFELFIISHKTKYPIIGEKINLHEVSKKWILKKKIFKNKKKSWINSHVFFLSTRDKKIKKIINLKCDYFIDDLVEILRRLPKKIKTLHFSPNKKNTKFNVSSWGELSKRFEYD